MSTLYLFDYNSYMLPTNSYVICEEFNINSYFFPHTHNYYELTVFYSGHAKHELNGILTDLTKGSFHFLSPNDIHSYPSYQNDALILKFYIDMTRSSRILSDLIESLDFPIFGELNENELNEAHDLYKKIKLEAADINEYTDYNITAYLLLITTLILKRRSKSGKSADYSKATPYKYVFNAVKFIREHYTDPIHLIDAAKNAHISPCYLSELFTKYTSYGYSQYLTSVRLNAACQMLVNTSMSVTEIAYSAGFSQYSSFFRAFCKYYSVTPTEFRAAKQFK